MDSMPVGREDRADQPVGLRLTRGVVAMPVAAMAARGAVAHGLRDAEWDAEADAHLRAVVSCLARSDLEGGVAPGDALAALAAEVRATCPTCRVAFCLRDCVPLVVEEEEPAGTD